MNLFENKHVDHFKSDKEKEKESWYIPTFDTLSSIAKSQDTGDLVRINNMIHGVLDKKEYNAFMNPFNFKDERHKNIPGTLRNYDIVMTNLRRFIGEYVTSYQEFHVVSKLPDEDNELLIAANDLAYNLLSKRAVNKIKELESGEQQPMEDSDVATEVEQFKSSWKDNRVINDFNMLEYIKAHTEDVYIYAKAYFHWITYGRYFIEHRVYNDDIVKDVLNPMICYPIINDEDFVEDYEAFYIDGKKSINQILSDYANELDDEQKRYLKDIEKHSSSTSLGNSKDVGIIRGLYKVVEVGELNAFGSLSDTKDFASNMSNVEVGTLYYKGLQKVAILKRLDELGNEVEEEVSADYELNPIIGDISKSYEWYPCTYVQYRFGSRYHGVYTKPKKLEVQRQEINNNAKVKLPITGKVGIFPEFPNHSIPKLLFPFQITINLLEMAKERAIITSQGKIGILPKELFGSSEVDQEEEMYNMLVIKKLLPDTSAIPNIATVSQLIRDIDLSDHDYIRLLNDLIAATKEAANEAIDMNRQRQGNTYASDGKGVNQEAIARVSMGSAIINSTFDISRCKDYEADIDYSKIAWINGKKAKFTTSDRQQAFFEVNPIAHMETEYGIHVTTAFEYDQQKQSLKDYAFSLGQNGIVDEDVILDVITNKNISKLKEILQVAKAARNYKEEQRFKEEQATRKTESENALKAKEADLDHQEKLNDKDNLTKLLIKEVELELKYLDMEQSDKDNEVLKNIQDTKQKLQTQLSILHNK